MPALLCDALTGYMEVGACWCEPHGLVASSLIHTPNEALKGATLSPNFSDDTTTATERARQGPRSIPSQRHRRDF